MKLRFGDFSFDGGRRLLLWGEEPVRLSSKAVELLALLLARRPDAVSKEDIQDALWPESIVTETTVATLVTEIRAALGDPARAPKLLRTVFGYGYAFDGKVEDASGAANAAEGPAPSSRHVLVWGSRELALREGENLVGRDPDVAVPIVHPSVSRLHGRVTVSGDRVMFEDLGSKNGTFVRGEKIHGPTPLRTGDEVSIGTVSVLYLDRRAAAADKTDTVP